jgi:hypothetical protein
MKRSPSEVADALEEIASHIRVTGRLDSLKQKELNVLVKELGQETEIGDFFSPAEIESISKLSATERMKIANRLENVTPRRARSTATKPHERCDSSRLAKATTGSEAAILGGSEWCPKPPRKRGRRGVKTGTLSDVPVLAQFGRAASPLKL